MYNEERKTEFLKSIVDQHSDEYLLTINSVFNKTEKFEEMFEKDLCDFSHEEIATMYSMFSYGSVLIYNTFNCNAKKYVAWCDEHMLIKDYINHFSEFGVRDYERYVDTRLESKKYLSRDDFEIMVQSLPNVRDQFLFRSLYEFGKSKNYVEITNMKLEDIDIKNQKVKLCTGRVVNVSRQFIETAILANNEMTYYFLVSGKERTFIESEYIFKIVGSTREAINENAVKFISRVIKHNLDLLGGFSKISSASLAVSGQLNMITERSKELGISKKDYIFNHFDELRHQYIMTPNNPKGFYGKYEAYL